MTELQKYVYEILLSGGSIVHNGGNIRVRDSEVRPKLIIKQNTFYSLKNVLRKDKGVWKLNKSAVRQLHGNNLMKRIYKTILNP